MVNDTPKTIEIKLTKGYVAIVDESDADLALQTWYAANVTENNAYAARRPISKGIKRQRFLHNVILERILERPLKQGEICDHKNGIPTDNRRSNLRVCKQAENCLNKRVRKDNKSGLKGATFDTSINRWRARIKANGAYKWLGCFDTPEEAHEAYCQASKELHGEFSRSQ